MAIQREILRRRAGRPPHVRPAHAWITNTASRRRCRPAARRHAGDQPGSRRAADRAARGAARRPRAASGRKHENGAAGACGR